MKNVLRLELEYYVSLNKKRNMIVELEVPDNQVDEVDLLVARMEDYENFTVKTMEIK